MIIQFSEFAKYSVNHNLYLYGIYLVNTTGIILLIAVFYKFFEHFLKHQALKKNRKHFFSTFGMTLLVIVLFNFWNGSFGQFKHIGLITQYIYFAFGSILMLLGLGWHIWSKVNIGKFWSDSIEIKEDHSLVQTGAYKWARHPMYASLLMWCFGAGFVMFNWATILICAAVFFPLMIIRAKAEEAELLKVNIDYNIYKQNTKMLCPTLKGATAIIVRVLALALFVYFVIKGINLSELLLLFFIQMYLGYSLTPEKVAFSYRSKSFIMVVVWLLAKFVYPPIYYFYYIMILMFAYGLKWNCPCMIVYEKFGGCPCFKLVKKACKL